MIEIINLGLNNLGSIVSALAASTKVQPRIISSADESVSPRLVILPGTGSFGAAMGLLDERGFRDRLRAYGAQPSVRIAGICLGMQLLGATSEESPGIYGLGLIGGNTRVLPSFDGVDGRVPHVGWAGLTGPVGGNSFRFTAGTLRDVYFSHSFHLVLEDSDTDVLTVSRGETRFVGAFRKNNITGYQFHPEKSSTFGLDVLTEMLRWAGIED